MFNQHEFCVDDPKNHSFGQQVLQGKTDTFWYQSYMWILYNKQDLSQIALFPYFFKLSNGRSSSP